MNTLVESFYTWYRNTLRHPKYRWLLVAGTLLYLVSPIDIAPDFLPIIGWIDDGVVAALLIAEVSQIMTEFLSGRSKREVTTDSAGVDQDTVIDVNAR